MVLDILDNGSDTMFVIKEIGYYMRQCLFLSQWLFYETMFVLWDNDISMRQWWFYDSMVVM